MTYTILVIEDDHSLRYSISLALETDGYRVISTGSVHEAEKHTEQADLILLDVMLPEINGITFCRNFREHSNKPIIFLTSCSDETDIIRGLDSGGDDYITKPFRLQELLSRIRANLRRVPSVQSTLELTAIEQKLLEYLMGNRDRGGGTVCPYVNIYKTTLTYHPQEEFSVQCTKSFSHVRLL